jgi:hypothetical protein
MAAVGADVAHLPALFLRSAAGAKRLWEFFTANIHRNTRRAYFVANATVSRG